MRKSAVTMADTYRVRRFLALIAVVALGATACQAADASTVGPEPVVVVGRSAAVVAVWPGADARKVDPNERIEVRASNGRLDQVRVLDDDNKRVKGSLGADGVWRSKGKRLAYATTYTVTAQAIDSAGQGKVVQSSFRTVKPSAKLTTSISPVGGQVVGVGMPVIVRLSSPVTDRAAVEEGLSVETSRAVVGSWSWLSDRELHWRPKRYWPADTDVTVRVALDGVPVGKGVWGAENRTVRYSVGNATVSTVDVDKHTMVVTQNGAVLRTIPITTGKDGFLTRGGTKVIVSKERTRVMDALTVDIPADSSEYYNLEVEYAMRLTWSGEFVHAAPWSVASQGKENVSHGCTGMSNEQAKWFYDLSKVGDVVVYTGSDRSLESGNGWTDWNVSWADWTAGSAL